MKVDGHITWLINIDGVLNQYRQCGWSYDKMDGLKMPKRGPFSFQHLDCPFWKRPSTLLNQIQNLVASNYLIRTSVVACSSFRLLFLLSCITAFGATSLLFVVELKTSLQTCAGKNPLAEILPVPLLLIGFCAIIAACFLIWIDTL